MMRTITLALLLSVGFWAKAQSYPSEWSKYSNGVYFFDIESNRNSQQIDEVKFRNDLLNLARTNLSKQIQVKVEEVSQIDKTSIDGHSNIQYSSSCRFTTDLDLKLTRTESYTDFATGTVFAIAYINKQEVCQYYENELHILLSKVDNAFHVAENHVQRGFKSKAKKELERVLTELDSAEETFFWLNIFGLPESQLQQHINEVYQIEQNLKNKVAELEHSTTYCIICRADNYGKPYPKLENEVKGGLSASGCTFVGNPEDADFVIQIEASVRESSKAIIANSEAFFSYIDASIAIDNNTTGQRIYEDEVSAKGVHTMNYTEAAREAYRSISDDIAKVLKDSLGL